MDYSTRRSLKVAQRIKDGYCEYTTCLNKRELGRRKCQKHLDEQKLRNTTRHRLRRHSNQCFRCGGEKEIGIFCSTCWFIDL